MRNPFVTLFQPSVRGETAIDGQRMADDEAGTGGCTATTRRPAISSGRPRRPIGLIRA